ncbi:hypothetical protein OG196_14215 [Kitasatospora purpeofusca]|uniref:hypothetical protein n=1 Tax=Kitasatospora purpeofusca TaxID=67352 RepID=UPI002E0D5C1E|nr:hypothetical protein OG196_14215 [Kitasatospora purpeofusca]
MPTALDDLARRIAALEAALPELSRSSHLAHSSVDDGALKVTSGGQLRAVIGQQPDGTTALNIVNGPTPPVPAAPTATSTLGGVRVGWNGRFANNTPSPLDFSRIEVHAATAASFTPSPATLVTTIESPQGGTATVPTTTPVWVVLVARSTSGKASGPSPTAFAGPAPVVAQDVLAGIVGELQLADDAVTAAKVAVGAIDAAALADAAVTATKLGQAAVTAGKLAKDAVTPGTVAADAITAREITAGAINTGELAAGAVSTANLAAGAVTAGQLAANAVTAAKLAAGAVTAGKIAADAVAAGTIAAAAITGREIKALAITADKLAANAVTADKIAAGAITTTLLAADAIDGRTIKGVTITGGILQTGQTGRRVLLAPTDPVDNSPAPSALLYSGADVEKQPARLTAEVRTTPDGSVPMTRLTGPQLTADGTQTPRLWLGSGSPGTAYPARGSYSLSVAGESGMAGEAVITGRGGDKTTAASIELSVRRGTGGYKTALTHLDPEGWFVQLADQVAAMYLSGTGFTVRALLGEVLLQTDTGLRLQGGNVDVGSGLVKNNSSWTPITFEQGCSQLPGWQSVTAKRRPDGMVALRGIVSVPEDVTSGVIGTIDNPALWPKAGEVFPMATPNNVGANLFVQPNGTLEIWNASGSFGGWLSLGSIEWSSID